MHLVERLTELRYETILPIIYLEYGHQPTLTAHLQDNGMFINLHLLPSKLRYPIMTLFSA